MLSSLGQEQAIEALSTQAVPLTQKPTPCPRLIYVAERGRIAPVSNCTV